MEARRAAGLPISPIHGGNPWPQVRQADSGLTCCSHRCAGFGQCGACCFCGCLMLLPTANADCQPPLPACLPALEPAAGPCFPAAAAPLRRRLPGAGGLAAARHRPGAAAARGLLCRRCGRLAEWPNGRCGGWSGLVRCAGQVAGVQSACLPPCSPAQPANRTMACPAACR